MKRKFYLLIAAFCTYTSVFAQEQEERGLEFPHQVITNGFWDNWFVGASVGANLYAGDHDQHLSLGNRLAPAVNAYVGKWFTPGLGVRATYSGLYWKGAALSPETDFARNSRSDGYFKQKGNFVNVHADMLLNLSEMLCGHNLQRVYSFIPYVGAGIMHSTSRPHNDELSFHAGIINRFRATDRLGINLELSGAWFKDRFDGEVGKKKVDGLGNVLVGLSYRIGKNGFDKNIIKFTGIEQAELDRANERANNLRLECEQKAAEIERLKAIKQEPEVQVVTTKSVAPVYVLFDLGKSSLSKAQRINLKYTAESIKSCPGQVFTLEGYADNSTGSAETNRRLSAERIATVKNCLVDEFGVPENQLQVKVVGGVENMFYNDPALSRAVIIK